MDRETKLRRRREGPFQKAKTDRDGLHAMLRPESRNAKTVPPHTHNALPILLLSFSPSPFCDSVQQCQGRGRHINSAFLNGGGGEGVSSFLEVDACRVLQVGFGGVYSGANPEQNKDSRLVVD